MKVTPAVSRDDIQLPTRINNNNSSSSSAYSSEEEDEQEETTTSATDVASSSGVSRRALPVFNRRLF